MQLNLQELHQEMHPSFLLDTPLFDAQIQFCLHAENRLLCASLGIGLEC